MAQNEKGFLRRSFLRAAASGLMATAGFMSAREFLKKKERDFRRRWKAAVGLVQDPSLLEQYARDFGNVCYARPWAVVYPESVKEVQEVIWFCNEHGIPLNTRGVGHACNGQSLLPAGIILDFKATMNRIQLVGETAVMEPGLTWLSAQQYLKNRGRGAPVLPDFMGLTVAGNLSIGGVGVRSLHFGHQSDHVQALELVTGKGEVVTCSRRENPDLFRFTLHGLGQLGVITKLHTATIPYRPRTLLATIYYRSYEEYIRRLHQLLQDNAETPYDLIYGFWPRGSFLYFLRLGKDDLGAANELEKFRKWVGSLGGKPFFHMVPDFEFWDHNNFAPNVARHLSWYHIYADEAPPLSLFPEMSEEVFALLHSEYHEIKPYINLYNLPCKMASATDFPLATLPRGPGRFCSSVGMEFDLPPGDLHLLEQAKEFVARVTDRYLPRGLAIYMYSWFRLTAEQRRLLWGDALDQFALVKKATDPNGIINPTGVINRLFVRRPA